MWVDERRPRHTVRPADGADYDGRTCRFCSGLITKDNGQRCAWSGLTEHHECAERYCQDGR